MDEIDLRVALSQYLQLPERAPKLMYRLEAGTSLPKLKFPIVFKRPCDLSIPELAEAIVHYFGHACEARIVAGYGKRNRAIRVFPTPAGIGDDYFIIVSVRRRIHISKMPRMDSK